jgi:hypothetical protein
LILKMKGCFLSGKMSLKFGLHNQPNSFFNPVKDL